MATDERLDEIERRLERLERALAEPRGASAPAAASASPADSEAALAPGSPPLPRSPVGHSAPAAAAGAERASRFDPSTLMAWGASLAFILAAAYFVKLVYDAGWLTPERQVGLAAGAGLALVAGGLGLARFDRAYAAYLPAVGVVVLYLSIFSGHVFYRLFGLFPALACVAAVTLGALWLGRRFDAGAYALLAVVGTYLTPLLIEAARADVLDLVVYFSAWGLLFSFVALQESRRATYLLALFFGLIGFDIAFRLTDERAWAAAAGFQLFQFVLFSATAVLFSVRRRQPMTQAEAAAHGLALFYFYVIEYILLKEHTLQLAPWFALASVGVVFGLYVFARRRLDTEGMRAGALLASTYCSVVTAHVLFFELMPEGGHAWAGLSFPVAFALLAGRVGGASPLRGAMAPVAIVSAVLFAIGFVEALSAERGGHVAFPEPLLVLYAVALYAAYAGFRRRAESHLVAPLPLYAAHAALLTVSVRVLDGALAVSVAWALGAIALLVYAVQRRDRMVGQSSLVIFSASSLKVLLHDLAGSTPIIRVGTLVVLAASLYAGGWLYQRMGGAPERLHPDPAVNEQLDVIRELVASGLDDAGVVRALEERGLRRIRSEAGWTTALIAQIRADYGFR